MHNHFQIEYDKKCEVSHFLVPFKGKNTLGRAKLGTFIKCIKSVHLKNVLHLFLGFIFGIWALYFDFHNVNNI
jgi:hypothetical protein